MNASNKGRKGSKVRGYAILGLFFISIVAAIMLGINWYLPIPTPPSGPVGGGNPPIYYKTTVVVENPWVGSPHIKRVYSECLGTSGVEAYYEYNSDNKSLLLFPFEGTVEARLYYAGGQHYVGAWKIK